MDDIILEGQYAFAEYALAGWATHLIVVGALVLDSRTPPIQSTTILKSIRETIGVFLDMHWQAPQKTSRVTEPMRAIVSDCVDAGDGENAWNLLQSLAAMHALTSSNDRETQHLSRDKVATNELLSVLDRVRGRIEVLSTDPAALLQLQAYYGRHLFKCPRLYCHWYHRGFETSQQRDAHMQDHEKPFRCLEPTCDRAFLGFSTKSELAEHVKKYHTDPTDGDFPSSNGYSFRAQTNTGPHLCGVCNKRFSKLSNRQAHERKHTQTADIPCTICKKTFATKGDRDRHEATHGSKKRFNCKGVTAGGAEWGCGRFYNRGDALSKHLKAKAGRACRQPMLDELDEESVSLPSEVVVIEAMLRQALAKTEVKQSVFGEPEDETSTGALQPASVLVSRQVSKVFPSPANAPGSYLPAFARSRHGLVDALQDSAYDPDSRLD